MTDALSGAQQAHTESRQAYLLAYDNLVEATRIACAGPHVPTQHRDGKPPWCKTCGYTSLGVQAEGILWSTRRA